MPQTRLSLLYLAGYLLFAGAALIIAPRFFMQLLFSTRYEEYGNILPRFAGVLLIVIGVIVVQIIRHHVEVLYPTTLLVRLFILVCLVGLYWFSRDPFFIVLIAIVGLGVLLTGSMYLSERRGAVSKA